MTLDEAKEVAAREDATPAERILLARVEALEAIISDADALLEPIFLPRSGRTIYADVRGHRLAEVVRRQV